MKRSLATVALLTAVCAAITIAKPAFLSPHNIDSVLLWMPILTVVAAGQLLVVLVGGIDVSVGSILGFAGIGVGLFCRAMPDSPIALAFVVGAAIGLVLGCVNAALVAYCRLPPLIVTIGTLASFRGLTFLLSKGDQIDSSVLPDGLMALASTGLELGSVTASYLLLISICVAVLVGALLAATPLGRNLRAIGSNSEAAFLRGVPVSRATFFAFAACGALAGLGGTLYASRFGFVNPSSAGLNLELSVIAAVAIGGAKLSGGSGSMVGTLCGCALLSVVNVALSVLGIAADWQMLAYGVVILVAVIADGAAAKRWVA
jgi:rhamnose transport system permease protein